MGTVEAPPNTPLGAQPRTPQTASSSKVAPRLSAGQTPMNPIDLTGPEPLTYSNPRKRTAEAALQASPAPAARRPVKKAKAERSKEKRLANFRSKPSQEFLKVYARALSQRFYVLKRTGRGTEECPEEEVEMTGSTGNVYTIVIAQWPKCTCPHARGGNRCKHVIYVLSRVLNAPYELVYQNALVPSELRKIFANAPAIQPSHAEAAANKRKPVEGDCPICFCEFEAAGAEEEIEWCRAACGQNMHKECFAMWARTKGGGAVPCPFCRSAWVAPGEGDVSRVSLEKGVLDEGYVNVADQLGISRVRDTSTYSPWMYRQSWGRGRHWY